jgi:hypothetical protein
MKVLLVAIGLIAAAAIVLGIDALRSSGAFRRIEPERGIAYLSYLDRASLNRGEALNGTVMPLDLNLASPTPRAAMGTVTAAWHDEFPTGALLDKKVLICKPNR